MESKKKLLYRKVNTRARGVSHWKGGDAKYDRNTKKGLKKGMNQGVQRGLDYTPLFKFLLSKVGEDWDLVYKEAKSRLDKDEPIFWMVAKYENDMTDYVRIGDHAYYSKLYVDENNKLQKVNSNFNMNNLYTCSCCTWTFNGKVITNKKAETHGIFTH